MKKWAVTGKVVGSKFLGIFEAETKEEALKTAEIKSYASLCHQCSGECEDPEIYDLEAYESEPRPETRENGERK